MGAGPRLRVLAAAALFSTGGAAVKATALTAWQVAGLRSAIAALFLLLALPAARRRPSASTLAVAVAYAATMLLFVVSNKLTTAANTIFLQSTAPLWVLMLAPRVLGERIVRRDVVFMAALALGMGLFFVGAETPSETAPDPGRGNLLAVAASLTWAATLLGLRGLGRRAGEARRAAARSAGGGRAVAADGGEQAAFWGNVLAFLVCVPLAGPYAGPGGLLSTAGAADWAGVVYLGVVQIGVAYVLLTAAMREVPALEASLLLLTEPVLSPVWAWLTLGERPSGWSIAGGVLIVGATALRTWLGGRRRRGRPGASSRGSW